jgi:hypothetical protein
METASTTTPTKMTLMEMIEEITSHCSKVEQWRVVDEVMACLKKDSLPKRRTNKKATKDTDSETTVSTRTPTEKQVQWRSLLARVREVLTETHGKVNKDGKKTMKKQSEIFSVASSLKQKGVFEPTSTEVLDSYDALTTGSAPPPTTSAKHEIYESEDDTLEDLAEFSESRNREIYNYLFRLQESGTTNMMGCARYLVERFGLTKDDANTYAQKYRTEYSSLKEKYYTK